MKTLGGNYIADFYCPKSKLVIEVDGGQHYSAEGKEKDSMRGTGKTVVRFSDREVLKNLDSVLKAIWRQFFLIKSPLTPLFQRGEERK